MPSDCGGAKRARLLAGPHPRDGRLRFEAAEHAYWWDGERVPVSVTGGWEAFFPVFNPVETVKNCYASWIENPASKYSALCQYLSLVEGVDEQGQKDAILALWEANRANAAGLGTAMHTAIEIHLRTGRLPNDDATPELRHYLRWREEVASAWQPLRSEWGIFDDRARVAGTIDSLWLDDENRLILVDWKRCKKGALTKKPYRGETGWGACAALPNTSLGHYTAQQNLYAAIVSRNYNLAIDAIYLVQLHPALKTYNCVSVPLLPEMAAAMLREYEQQHA